MHVKSLAQLLASIITNDVEDDCVDDRSFSGLVPEILLFSSEKVGRSQGGYLVRLSVAYFAPKPSRGFICHSPSYTVPKLLFFLFNFATARFWGYSSS